MCQFTSFSASSEDERTFADDQTLEFDSQGTKKNNLYGKIRHRELEQMESKVNLQGLIEGVELIILIDRQH